MSEQQIVAKQTGSSKNCNIFEVNQPGFYGKIWVPKSEPAQELILKLEK